MAKMTPCPFHGSACNERHEKCGTCNDIVEDVKAHFTERHVFNKGDNPWPVVEFQNEITLSKALDGLAVVIESVDDSYGPQMGVWRDHGDTGPGVLFYLHDAEDDTLVLVGTFVGNVKRIEVLG